MPRVYVVGASRPAGGAYMAYHLGRLLHLHFGYELFDATNDKNERQIFHYDVPFKTINLTGMIKEATKHDVLIVNPIFSQYLFGLMLPARKICYVQGFQTFDQLDCHFDLYVAVSHVVQRFLEAVYGISAPVIPPFVELDATPPARPWRERPEGSALVYIKKTAVVYDILLKRTRQKLRKTAPKLDLSRVVKGHALSHREFLQRIGEVRYFVNLSLAEGFGLAPLEAMAMGTMVTGLDGLAGRDYMRQGDNCLVSSITGLHTLPDVIRQAFSDEALAAKCVAGGMLTAQSYGYEPFKAAWLAQLSRFLQTEPSGVTAT